MRWVLIGLGVVVGLVVLATLVGMMRPKEHVATTRAKYAAPPDQLWATITDVARWAEWNPEVRSVELLPERDGRRRMNVVGSWGTAPTEVTIWEPPRRFETYMNAGGFRGSWSYELSPSSEGGTLLVVTEKGEVDNPLFRAMMIFMDKHATMMAFHRALAERTRDSVTPEKVIATR
jgi:uncharacterized protein YndB with AHSA1/START domain